MNKILACVVLIVSGCYSPTNVVVKNNIQPKAQSNQYQAAVATNIATIYSSVYGSKTLSFDGVGWIGVDSRNWEWKLIQLSNSWWDVSVCDLSNYRKPLYTWKSNNLSIGIQTVFNCENPNIAPVTVTLN